MDRLEAMQIFLAPSDTGSFPAASRKLGIPLPTVSRKVSELEDHLKSRLLVRTTRKLSLTDAGAAYLASAKRILDEINAAETLASGEYTTPRGELILPAPITFGRFHGLGIVNDFLKQYPEINIRMLISGYCLRKSLTMPSTWKRPKVIGAGRMSSPRGVVYSPEASVSAALISSRMRFAEAK